jgi:ABC-2 type transport system permease protein
MTRWAQVRMVAQWEFGRFVKWKQQFIGLAVMVAVAGLGQGFLALKARSTPDAVRVVVVGAGRLGFPLPAVAEVRWDTLAAVDAAGARVLVRDDSAAGALLVRDGSTSELVIRRRGAWTQPLEGALAAARQQRAFAALPITPADRERLAGGFTVTLTTVTASGAQVSRGARMVALAILAFGLTVLFTGFATLFTGITGEKQQRITEQMIAMVSPQTWMDGKILGLAGAATVGAAIFFGGGSLVLRAVPLFGDGEPFALPAAASDVPLLLLVLLVTALGVLMWFSFMAAVAATIDDPNSSSRSLLLFVPMLPMGIAFSLLPKADSVLAQVLSVVPLTSMGMLPARLLTTHVPWWEVVASVALLAGTAWLFRRLAGTIFATGMLLYGKEPSLAEVVRWAREG